MHLTTTMQLQNPYGELWVGQEDGGDPASDAERTRGERAGGGGKVRGQRQLHSISRFSYIHQWHTEAYG